MGSALFFDHAELNFDQIIDEMTAEISEILSGTVEHIPLGAVNCEG